MGSRSRQEQEGLVARLREEELSRRQRAILSAKEWCFSNVGGILHDGTLYYGNNPVNAINASDGSLLRKWDKGLSKQNKWPAGSDRDGRGHLVRAGDALINTATDTVVRSQSLADPTKILGVGHLGSEWHRELMLQKLSTEDAITAVGELPWIPCMQNWAPMQTTVWPQGDRLYIRTKDSLYCIGPKTPHHTPATAPASARTAE